VCGGVCNNATEAPDCFPTSLSGSGEATVKSTNAISFAEETDIGPYAKQAQVWGTVPPGGWCDEKKDCAWTNKCINNQCAYSGLHENCTINYLTKWVTPGTKIPTHQEILKKFPEVMAYGNSDCNPGYICFQKSSQIDESSRPKANNLPDTPNPGKVPLYRGYCIPNSDINGDGTVNIVDITIVAKDFGKLTTDK
jgi:hypothetical protein